MSVSSAGPPSAAAIGGCELAACLSLVMKTLLDSLPEDESALLA